MIIDSAGNCTFYWDSPSLRFQSVTQEFPGLRLLFKHLGGKSHL
jgi:hypothetical protein